MSAPEDRDLEGWIYVISQELRAKPRSACALVRRDGLVLGVARKGDPSLFGLPGGKLEEGETFAEAAARELKEETGMTASGLRPAFIAECDGYLCATFEATVDAPGGEREPQEVRWCRPEELVRGPFLSYNEGLFEALGIG